MPKYIIYFNQQWVGDHSEEWFNARGPLARKVVEEIELAIGMDETGRMTEPVSSDEFIGGLTIVDVDTEEDAKMWGSKIAVACGWPQEIRKFKD